MLRGVHLPGVDESFLANTPVQTNDKKCSQIPKNTNMEKKIFNNIFWLRYGFPMSQEAFAERVGIARQTLIGIEQGAKNPSLYTALRIAKALEVSMEKVFSLDKKPMRRLIIL